MTQTIMESHTPTKLAKKICATKLINGRWYYASVLTIILMAQQLCSLSALEIEQGLNYEIFAQSMKSY